MKDYDIKIKNASEVLLYGTDNDTIVVPSQVKFDSDRDQADIDIKGIEKVVIGIPSEAGHIELFIEDVSLTVRDISFERMEIDGSGKVQISLENSNGCIDVNLVSGEAEMNVSPDYSFTTRTEGKNNVIDCQASADPSSKNVVELNGRNSRLTIKG